MGKMVEVDADVIKGLADIVDGRYYTKSEIEYETGITDEETLERALAAVAAVILLARTL